MSIVTLANTLRHIPDSVKADANTATLAEWHELVEQTLNAEINADHRLAGHTTIKASWYENNNPFLDFRFRLHFDEMEASHDLVLDFYLVANPAPNPWNITIIADSTDGPLPKYGDMTFHPGDFKTSKEGPSPLAHIIGTFIDSYKKKSAEAEQQNTPGAIKDDNHRCRLRALENVIKDVFGQSVLRVSQSGIDPVKATVMHSNCRVDILCTGNKDMGIFAYFDIYGPDNEKFNEGNAIKLQSEPTYVFPQSTSSRVRDWIDLQIANAVQDFKKKGK